MILVSAAGIAFGFQRLTRLCSASGRPPWPVPTPRAAVRNYCCSLRNNPNLICSFGTEIELWVVVVVVPRACTVFVVVVVVVCIHTTAARTWLIWNPPPLPSGQRISDYPRMPRSRAAENKRKCNGGDRRQQYLSTDNNSGRLAFFSTETDNRYRNICYYIRKCIANLTRAH